MKATRCSRISGQIHLRTVFGIVVLVWLLGAGLACEDLLQVKGVGPKSAESIIAALL